MSGSRTDRVRALNDRLRITFKGGKLMMTAGVQAKGEAFVARALANLRGFTSFTPDNDPHGEHDFGMFDVEGEKCIFKIDYYDPTMEYGSEDPADPAKTTRVLTLMLASEY